MRHQRSVVHLVLFTIAGPVVAQELPKVDVFWDAEHLPESLQDSRLLALPWPGHALEAGRWQRTLDLGWQSTTAELADARGFLLSGGATRARSDRFGIGAFAFFDQADLSGGSSRGLLRPSLQESVPIDLPAFAELTDPRGTFRHYGVGGDLVWQKPRGDGAWRRTIVAGAYFDRLDLRDYRAGFELESGADAGARGTLDWSATYDFATPFVGISWTRDIGRSWTITPRLIAGQPVPRQRVEATIQGEEFTVAGEGHNAAMGDGYLGGGFAFEHLPTGLSFDLGGTLWYAATESVTHEGIDRAILAHISWTF